MILHIITNLEKGGAEAQLKQLVRYDYQNNHLIICLMSDGKYHLSDIKNNKIKIYQLNFKKFSFNLYQFYRLFTLIKTINPHIVQTWMYKSDLVGGLIARLAGKKVFWNIRNTLIQETSF